MKAEKRTLRIWPLFLSLFFIASAFTYATCSVRSDELLIQSIDLADLQKVDISELTPTEVKRLDILINQEPSPCGEGYTVAQALLDPNICPLVIHARDYIVTLLKQDYDEDEVSVMYQKRYTFSEGIQIPLSGSPRMGAHKPVVSIVVFSDFQCPHCARAATMLKDVTARYSEQVELVFKHFPLESIHPNAILGSRAAFAAGEQNKFWEMHDVLFSRGKAGFDPDKLRTFAIGLGLDAEKFETDLSSDKALTAINADMELGKKLQVNSTPFIFVNGRAVEGGVSHIEDRIKEEFMRQEYIR